MDTVTLASDGADADALRAIEEHHVELSSGLALRADAVLRAVRDGGGSGLGTARRALATWARRELQPHAQAEETTIYAVARQDPRLTVLVRAMSTEHDLLVDLIGRVETVGDATTLVADVGALHALFSAHVERENELLLPALAASAEVSLASLLDEMHRALAELATRDPAAVQTPDVGHGAAEQRGDAHACGCHEDAAAGLPELDARLVPHDIRHATVFGALDAVGEGGGMVLVAPHDPLPLLAQIEQRHPGVFDVEYLERGPEAWRLQFVHRVAS